MVVAAANDKRIGLLREGKELAVKESHARPHTFICNIIGDVCYETRFKHNCALLRGHVEAQLCFGPHVRPMQLTKWTPAAAEFQRLRNIPSSTLPFTFTRVWKHTRVYSRGQYRHTEIMGLKESYCIAYGSSGTSSTNN